MLSAKIIMIIVPSCGESETWISMTCPQVSWLGRAAGAFAWHSCFLQLVSDLVWGLILFAFDVIVVLDVVMVLDVVFGWDVDAGLDVAARMLLCRYLL